jgi:exopolysaccharide biosynthesis predicted pyruvyltransferase EpsI
MQYLLTIAKKLNSFKQNIKQSSVHIYIYANRKNAGDFLSAKGIKMAVGINGKEEVIEKNLNKLKNTFEKNKDLKLIIGGGGLLKNSFEEFWQTVLHFNLKYVCFGIGVCDIKGQNSLLPDEIFKEVVINAENFWARDSRTSMIIESKYGVKTKQVLCPSVLYIYKKYGNLNYKRFGTKPILLYSHHKGLLRASKKEDNFIRNVLKKICKNNNFIFLEVDNICKNPDTLLKQYITADIIVSTRLHGCIFSYALNKPFIAISADLKIESFVHDYCDAEVFDVNEITEERLNRAVNQKIYSSPRKEDFLYNVHKIIDAGNAIRTSLFE